ncbi:hypothetical protein [Butyricimonas synergistica]|uniref:hypothetical protein n=1 Tax=Butyricimonas synergistica TaxID=544644 RepID=UPI0003643089|nr:hypothetical protein [Butyricimonas synergistica]
MRIIVKCIKIFMIGIASIIVLFLITVAINRTLASKWMLELRKKELKTPNPTAYTFNYPLLHVRKVIIEKFNKKEFRDMLIHGKGTFFGNIDYCTEGIIDKVGNENDFVLGGSHVLESFTYRTGKRGRYCNMRLQIHLDSISPTETRVEVISHDREIISGYKLGIAHMSFIVPIFQTFDPTTIEEYQVLYNIGKYLGVDMPKVNYPEDLSDQQIFATFCNGVKHRINSTYRPSHLIGNEK